ncbi:MAG: hypothetical protein ACRC8S_12395 [Fimbriiglobus sp.]
MRRLSLGFLALWCSLLASVAGDKPARTEVVEPIRNETFNKKGKAEVRKQGGNPRELNGVFVFDGSMDGNRQVDPQIAVGNGFVFHGTNSGLIIYDTKGKFVQGVPQRAFNDGIDPKLFYDIHNKVFCFDLWHYYDKPKKKPVNVSVSETADPTGAWNTYPISATQAVDGGAIGYSKTWIGYSFPGGPEQTFVLKTAEAKAGKPATVYHFAGNLGIPVNTLDPLDDLYFLNLTAKEIILTRVGDSGDGTPHVVSVTRQPHDFQYFGYPPQSPQRGTMQKTSSGDRNPKNLFIMADHLWFSHAVNCEGRSAVQWHQFRLDGKVVQSGRIAHKTNSYIQTTLAVNKQMDVLIGFQETGPDMFISPRLAYRKASDAPGTTREIISLGEGEGPTDGVAWGDYSGATVDGDNLLDLWTIQSRANAKGRGETVIAKIPFPATAKAKK